MSQTIHDLIDDLRAYTQGVPIDIKKLRAALRNERIRRHMTQEELAEASQMKQSVISRIENIEGEEDLIPKLPSVIQLVHGLGLTMGEFFSRLEGLHESGASDKTTVAPPSPTDANVQHVRSSIPASDPAHARLVAFINDLVTALLTVVENHDAPGESPGTGESGADPDADEPRGGTPRRRRG